MLGIDVPTHGGVQHVISYTADSIHDDKAGDVQSLPPDTGGCTLFWLYVCRQIYLLRVSWFIT